MKENEPRNIAELTERVEEVIFDYFNDASDAPFTEERARLESRFITLSTITKVEKVEDTVRKEGHEDGSGT